MKRILLLALICLPIMVSAQSKKKNKQAANQQTMEWRYEIEPVTTDKSLILKVWSYSKDPGTAQEQAKKNAVHSVIFKGVPAKDRTAGRRALVEDFTQERSEFFQDFFKDGGDYMRFVALTNTGALEAGSVVKTGKKEYKVGVNVNVSYDDLRKYLETKGIVKKLGFGF